MKEQQNRKLGNRYKDRESHQKGCKGDSAIFRTVDCSEVHQRLTHVRHDLRKTGQYRKPGRIVPLAVIIDQWADADSEQVTRGPN